MSMHPAAGMAKLMRRVESLARVPNEVIAQAHRHLMPLIPVYTSTYAGGVDVQFGKDFASLLLTEDALMMSARSHAGEILSAVSLTPEEYVEDTYPIRIEAAGRPTDNEPSGQDAWRDTREIARNILNQQLRSIAAGRMGL